LFIIAFPICANGAENPVTGPDLPAGNPASPFIQKNGAFSEASTKTGRRMTGLF
jgi:hypothetical protein